jgi:VIT1/CCC1 family predicted Fe2+/Mn2+ transporter
MNFKKKMEKWKEYSKMADLPIIARRKFFNNCFDGALTTAGIVSGFLILFLMNPKLLTPLNVLITGFATALAIGISGLWGAFLSEDAERKKKLYDLKKAMAMTEEGEDGEIQSLTELKSKRTRFKKKKKINKKKESIIEKAENFATIIASLVDGGAPVLGAALPLIPFFFGFELSIYHFIFSYLILICLLIYLGIFLGNISGGGRIKYALNLVIAGLVTLLISILLGAISG